MCAASSIRKSSSKHSNDAEANACDTSVQNIPMMLKRMLAIRVYRTFQ